MSTIVWPRLFESEYAPVHDERSAAADPKMLLRIFEKFKINKEALPIALRWRVHPDLGFPREPFGVFRRPWNKIPAAKSLSVSSGTYSNRIIGWGNIPLIELYVYLASTPTTCKIEALDEHQEALYDEFVHLSASTGIIRFHHPNICSIRITGNAHIDRLEGLSMNDYANDDQWELIEEVGLPYKRNEVSLPVYDARLQGKPGSLVPGDEAAFERLRIGLTFSERPPATTPAGHAAPAWITPNEMDVLNEIRQAGSTLDLITKMLHNVNPAHWIGNQNDYTESIANDGISQEGGSSSSDPSTFDIPTAPMFLLGAANDIHPALGLGFGTMDFPGRVGGKSDYIEPVRSFSLGYDYMVAVHYELPFGLKLRMAALSSPTHSWPGIPANVQASQYQRNRGINLDDPEKEDVQINWERQARFISPHGFYVGISEGGHPPVILNSKRSLGAGWIPVIPAMKPDSDTEHEANVTYIDPNRRVPYTGSRTDRYEVVAQDVFGRCSNWGTSSHSLGPKGPDIPALLELKFDLDTGSTSGRSMPATLQIDLVWDWEDRGPAEIELTGKFFTPIDPPGSFDTSVPGSAPSGIHLTNGGFAGSSLKLTFSDPMGGGESEVPSLSAGTTANIEILPSESGDGQAVRYRVLIEGFALNFSSDSKLHYAVYARAAEKVNPSLYSPYSKPISISAVDTLPADAPSISPNLRWASLPDATGIARYKVNFPAIEFADSYLIFEATEAAMRHAASLSDPADNELTTRVLDLQTLPFTGKIIDTFTRMTRDPLPAPEIEVSLPGSTDGIYAYNFASLTSENIESARSNTIYVAVPRRLTPGAPGLKVNKGETEGTVDIKLEAGTGTPPVAMEIYRTRSSMLSVDVDKIGPPRIEKTDPSWIKLDEDELPVTDLNGAGKYFSVQDTVKPGWYPYYYRGIAWGPNDQANGNYPGRSESSARIDIFVPPEGPPDLQAISVTESSDGSLWKIAFRSLAEWRLPPIGSHILSVQTVDRSAQTLNYSEQVHAELYKIEELTASPTESAGQVYRHSRDAEGRWLYESYITKGDTHVSLILTDPLERKTVVKAELVAPLQAPDLLDVSFNRVLFWLTIRFKSSVPLTPPSGTSDGYIVETFDADSSPWHLFNRTRIHQIGTSGGLGRFKRNDSPDSNGRYHYSITRCIWFRTVNEVAVRITSSSGLLTELTS